MGAAEDCSLLVLPGTGQCGLTQLISPREAARFIVTRPSSGAVRLDPATALPALKVTPSRNIVYVSEGGFDSCAFAINQLPSYTLALVLKVLAMYLLLRRRAPKRLESWAGSSSHLIRDECWSMCAMHCAGKHLH